MEKKSAAGLKYLPFCAKYRLFRLCFYCANTPVYKAFLVRTRFPSAELLDDSFPQFSLISTSKTTATVGKLFVLCPGPPFFVHPFCVAPTIESITQYLADTSEVYTAVHYCFCNIKKILAAAFIRFKS